MLVKEWMSKPVMTINADDSLAKTINLFKQHAVSMLPVMDHNKLTGVVTEQALKQALQTDIQIKDIMAKDFVAVHLDCTVEETAQVLLKHNISGVSVVDDEGKLNGTISQTDVLRAIISLTGVDRGGIQFGFEVEDRPGAVKVLTDIIGNYGGRMESILSCYGSAPRGYRRVYVRMHGIDRFKLHRLEAELKEKATLLYMVDRFEVGKQINSAG